MIKNNKKKIVHGVVHRVPEDLQKALVSNSVAQKAWEDITPLARNEWICWVTSGKKAETRSTQTLLLGWLSSSL
ncbi:MAG: hypothetical protein UU06_C0028G0011 [Parcubacteria group bacterium GW2011_GWB1_40_5]|nr:MAG: hypothetical protein UU06_C0028G0011 [Parcubacteria group bacterium GW2011_GWB1_40_5]